MSTVPQDNDPAANDSTHKSHEADATWGSPTAPESEKASRSDQKAKFEDYEDRADIESRESINGRFHAAPGEYSVRAKVNGDTVPVESVDDKDNAKRDN